MLQEVAHGRASRANLQQAAHGKLPLGDGDHRDELFGEVEGAMKWTRQGAAEVAQHAATAKRSYWSVVATTR